MNTQHHNAYGRNLGLLELLLVLTVSGFAVLACIVLIVVLLRGGRRS